MYFHVQRTTKPITTVDIPRIAHSLEQALGMANLGGFMNRECSIQIYKIPDGYTPQERILIIRMDWEGLK